MIRMTLPTTLPIITYMVNRSIETGICPDDWKCARVKPIAKGSSIENYKDLRPISILPVLSKIIERVICTQLTRYLEKNRILPVIQSGFRSGHGTATALAHVADNVLAASHQGEGTILVLLDFSRAFDCLSSDLLLAKMSYYGISSSACH
jgi:hypothetical protein